MRTAFDLGSATIPAVRRPNWSSRIEHLSMIRDRKSTRLNSSHGYISYAVFCLKKKKTTQHPANVLLSYHQRHQTDIPHTMRCGFRTMKPSLYATKTRRLGRIYDDYVAQELYVS